MDGYLGFTSSEEFITDEDAVYGLRKTLDLLDEDEDVKAYYTNWEEE